MAEYDVIVAGGGPAGTAAAITAARAGRRVLLLEAGRYPRHKVCGEFVSPEAVDVLCGLISQDDILAVATRISRVRLFLDGRMHEAALEPSALSIPRIVLDATLWRSAQQAGVDAREGTVVRAVRADRVETATESHRAQLVIDATGRSSNLRPVPAKGAAIGLKAHVFAEHEPGTLDLYVFPGGYCGVQPISKEQVNVCALVDPRAATTFDELFAACPDLAARSHGWEFAMKPLATAGLAPGPGEPDAGGILRVGDAAGFIDPFAGDGISLALRSGKLAASLASEAYGAAYRRNYARLFDTAALARRFLHVPASFRKPLLAVLGRTSALKWLIRHTR